MQRKLNIEVIRLLEWVGCALAFLALQGWLLCVCFVWLVPQKSGMLKIAWGRAGKVMLA